jgi:hypothetical protein
MPASANGTFCACILLYSSTIAPIIVKYYHMLTSTKKSSRRVRWCPKLPFPPVTSGPRILRDRNTNPCRPCTISTGKYDACHAIRIKFLIRFVGKCKGTRNRKKGNRTNPRLPKKANQSTVPIASRRPDYRQLLCQTIPKPFGCESKMPANSRKSLIPAPPCMAWRNKT